MRTAFEAHEIADVFPMMGDADYAALRTDIEARGLIEPIWLYRDKILDGRNRYRACSELGIDPDVRVYAGDDPVGFVVSLNLKRRHLTESQRAMIAAEIASLGKGQRPPKPDASIEASGAEPKPVPAVPQAKAAEMLSVSRSSVQRASKVRDKAAPRLKDAVKKGEVHVSAAAEVADLPPAEQEEVVAKGAEAVAEKAKEVRRGKTKINGVLQDDPDDIAALRAAGKIRPETVVEITNVSREPGEDDDEPEAAPDPESLDDRAWLESLESRATIEPACLPTFDADALIYRALEPHRKTFAHHATRALNASRRKGEYAFRVERFLRMDHPKHWLRCPPMAADEGGGCGGSGYIVDMFGKKGQCPKCRGRGYWIK